MVKNPPANAGDVRDTGSIPGWGRSLGGGHGNPLQHSCLENPMNSLKREPRTLWSLELSGLSACFDDPGKTKTTHFFLRTK